MSMPRIKTLRRRRTPGAPRSRRIGAAVQAQSPPRAALDASWEAIVAQLLATPSDPQADEAQPEREYAWARRLGMHINRHPKPR